MARPKQPKKVEDEKEHAQDPAMLSSPALTSTSLRMSYRIARGEQGVLTFEPYKSLLLPFWRFRTASIAEHSSAQLWTAFDAYLERGDFVGADMARKFIQMGMTRAKRYANHKGGKKYDRSSRVVERDGGGRTELPKSEGHDGKEEKLRASETFRACWRRAVEDDRYVRMKGGFLAEQKAWDRERKKVVHDDHGAMVKRGVKLEDEDDVKQEVQVENLERS